MATRQRAALRPLVMAPQAGSRLRDPTRRLVGVNAASRSTGRPIRWRQLRRLAVDTDATMRDPHGRSDRAFVLERASEADNRLVQCEHLTGDPDVTHAMLMFAAMGCCKGDRRLFAHHAKYLLNT